MLDFLPLERTAVYQLRLDDILEGKIRLGLLHFLSVGLFRILSMKSPILEHCRAHNLPFFMHISMSTTISSSLRRFLHADVHVSLFVAGDKDKVIHS